jgi:hypothetical protein
LFLLPLQFRVRRVGICRGRQLRAKIVRQDPDADECNEAMGCNFHVMNFLRMIVNPARHFLRTTEAGSLFLVRYFLPSRRF